MGIRREKLGHVPRLFDSIPNSIIRQVSPPTVRLPMPRIGGHRSPTVASVQTPWAVLEEACLSIRGQRCRPLAEATLPSGSHVRDRIWRVVLLLKDLKTVKNCLQCLRPVGVMKMSSSVNSIGVSGNSFCPVPIRFRPISRNNAAGLDLGLADWDVPFHSRFLSPGLKFFLLFSEFLPSQSELFHRLAFGPSHQNRECQKP